MTLCSRYKTLGFTLVELQVALLLVAVIAASLGGALHLSSRTWQAVDARQTASEQRYLLTTFLRRHLTNARFLEVVDEENETYTSFLGDEHQLHFVAPFPTFHNDGDLFWWTLKLALEEEGVTLVLEYQPYLDLQQIELADDGSLVMRDNEEDLKQEEQPVTVKQLVLSEQVTSLVFDYYVLDNASNGWQDGSQEERKGEWQNQFILQQQPPQVVRIRMEQQLAEQEREALPELIISFRFNDQTIFSTQRGAL